MKYTNLSADELISVVELKENPSALEQALCKKLCELTSAVRAKNETFEKISQIADKEVEDV